MDLTEDDVIGILLPYFESLFPQHCSNCGRHFPTLEVFVRDTVPIGPAVSYDAQCQHWQTERPLGSAAFSNCPCGSTITLTTQRLAPASRRLLLQWLQQETLRRDVSASDVLDGLRLRIRRLALGGRAGDAAR